MTDNQLILASHVINAERFIEALEKCGGNLKKFLESVPHDNATDEEVIASIERMLRACDDKQLYKRWEAAINQNVIVRLRLLQEKTLQRLENIDTNPWGEDAKGNTVLKMSDEIALARLILGDVIAGRVQKAKAKPEAVEESDDDDEADLADVMAGA